MKDDPMDETTTYEARAARARQNLSDNLRDITDVGGEMLRRTKRLGASALFGLAGLAALGMIALVASRFRRRTLKQELERYLPAEPSFLKQALRSVALSMLSVLASRVARRLPLPASTARVPAE